MLLALAIAAKVPIIAITTTDTVNAPDIITNISGQPLLSYKVAANIQKDKLYVTANAETIKKSEFATLHTTLESNNSTLIVINPPYIDKAFFIAGDLPVPKDMIAKLIGDMAGSEMISTLMPAVGGCTLKDVTDFIRLTTARDHSLTSIGLMKTRKEFFPQQKGLTHVDTTLKFYQPPKELQEFIDTEKSFFLNSEDPRLRARGLLLDGPPGTGKTEAARYIANCFGTPLFRLDIAGAKNKYVGESESNLSQALARVDHEEPCVILLDEIEKLFGEDGEGGTSRSMLSQVLWWLQEHQTRVLTIMTTNKKSALLPELYRPGRIDQTMMFNGLEDSEAKVFIKTVMETFAGLPSGEPDDETLDALLVHAQELQPDAQKGSGYISQGILVKAATDGVKTLLS